MATVRLPAPCVAVAACQDLLAVSTQSAGGAKARAAVAVFGLSDVTKVWEILNGLPHFRAPSGRCLVDCAAIRCTWRS